MKTQKSKAGMNMNSLRDLLAIAVILAFAVIGMAGAEQLSNIVVTSTAGGDSDVDVLTSQDTSGGFIGYQSDGVKVTSTAGDDSDVNVGAFQSAARTVHPIQGIGVNVNNLAGDKSKTDVITGQSESGQTYGSQTSGISGSTKGFRATSSYSQFQFEAGSAGTQSECKDAITAGFAGAKSENIYSQVALNGNSAEQEVIAKEKVSTVLGNANLKDCLNQFAVTKDGSQGINLGADVKSLCGDTNTDIGAKQKLINLNPYPIYRPHC
jgi:hypothetical protein